MAYDLGDLVTVKHVRDALLRLSNNSGSGGDDSGGGGETGETTGVYGATWDGTSTTAFTRTDLAAEFTDPVPYKSGATSYSSPFDNIQPWAGMVRSTDANAGEVVAIPKFWYKLESYGTGGISV
ncbi:MAG: hypothetical protein IJP88_11275, partial [Synergistaceae bacterium]|nr:hypothetical protein [Synergistaceae bacterium]